jgi:hypothetical protein
MCFWFNWLEWLHPKLVHRWLLVHSSQNFILIDRKQIGKEIFWILYAGKQLAFGPFEEFWPLHLASVIHLVENFCQILTHTKDFSWKKIDPNSPDFKDFFSKIAIF